MSVLARCNVPDPNNARAQVGRNEGTVGGEGHRPTLLKRAGKCVARRAVLGRLETSGFISR